MNAGPGPALRAARVVPALALAAALAGCIVPPTGPEPAPALPSSDAPAAPPPPGGAEVARPARLVPPAGRPARAPEGASGAATFPVAGSGASAQCLAAIEAFAERHSGNRVMLGQAAFAGSDQLVLTRAPHRGPDGRPLDGRAPAPAPLVLRLLATTSGCAVRVAEGGAKGAGAPPIEAALPDCACRPLSERKE